MHVCVSQGIRDLILSSTVTSSKPGEIQSRVSVFRETLSKDILRLTEEGQSWRRWGRSPARGFQVKPLSKGLVLFRTPSSGSPSQPLHFGGCTAGIRPRKLQAREGKAHQLIYRGDFCFFPWPDEAQLWAPLTQPGSLTVGGIGGVWVPCYKHLFP